MAKRVAKKKKATRKKSAPAAKMEMSGSCGCESTDMWLCKISLIAAVFFVMSLIPALGNWIVGVQWWIWLVIAIVVGWKPMMKYMKK